MDPELEIDKLLKADGAVLRRSDKHLIWRLSNGKNFVRAATPSDRRAAANSLSALRSVLGITGTDGRGTPGERRDSDKPGVDRPVKIHSSMSGSLQDALRSTGLVEAGLRHQIDELSDALAEVLMDYGALEAKTSALVKPCWFCRLRRRFGL